jgi:DNA repair photolyase
MKLHYGVKEPWGDFVLAKKNVLDVLDRELSGRRKPAKVWIASVTDAWQPAEAELRLTRGCIERLLNAGFPLSLLTKSTLILRDLDLIRSHSGSVEVGITVTTDDERISKTLEPYVPIPSERIAALARLSEAGIDTHAFVGPTLPMNPGRLARQLRAVTKRVLIDGMNYRNRVQEVYRRNGWTRYLLSGYFGDVVDAFRAEFGDGNVQTCW